MAKEKEKHKPVFNVAVVGLSGTEQFKGQGGIGKSCLCNRFVRPLADDYYPEHTSVLSQSDFGGRVVSNDHFLYWGEVKKYDDSGLSFKFNVIEQTEFLDDQSYQPHRSSSNQVYHKRCAQTKLSSAEKLMYICTDQLGIENDFEQKPLPEGKLTIDGFLLCFDVSHVINRTIDDQVKFVQNCYHYLSKTKKPIVLVLTKCDEPVAPFVKEAEKFASSPGGKKGSLLVVETSAAENINVELAFMVLAQLIDKNRPKSKIINFDDASKMRQEILNHATQDLTNLLLEVVRDYHDTWMSARKNLENKPEYQRYVDLLGKNSASKIFRKHVNRLRDEYRIAMQNAYLRHLPRALRVILAEVSSLASTWQDTLNMMRKRPSYNDWFITLESSATPWYESDHVNLLDDRRIPVELLRTPDAESMFLNHKTDLEQKQRHHIMKLKFKDGLINSPQVTPGREWDDVVKYFREKEELQELTETEILTIYDRYQAEITEKAKTEFQELLYEKAEVFVSGNTSGSTHMDIHYALKMDKRYIAMDRLNKERDDILTRHISCMLYPIQDEWGSSCLKHLVSKLKKTKPIDKAPPSSQWQLGPDSETLNVVVLGADGLSRELANEITVQSSSDDEYTLDGCIHSLRLRSIDGDVSQPLNSFKTSSFSPHGCIAVYSTLESLRYIQKSLELTVMQPADGGSSKPPPFQGLPVSILLASQGGSEQEVSKLRAAGEHLSSLLGCPFIDVVEPEYAYIRRFHESQIRLAMRSLIEGIKERAEITQSSGGAAVEPNNVALDPDIRIVVCTMADDFAGAETALSPLLNHASRQLVPPKDDKDSFVSDDKEEPSVGDSITVETYLGSNRRRIQVTLTSYQSARHLLNRRQTVHGFILLFSTNSLASFSVMKVFAKYTVSAYPLQIVCLPSAPKDSFSKTFFHEEKSKLMVIDANIVADELHARFMTVSPNHSKQTEVYTTFFKDAWEQKQNTEAINSITRAVVDDNPTMDEDTTLGLDFSAFNMDNSKSSNQDENFHSRPFTPEKPYEVPQSAAMSSTESLPQSLTRPTLTYSERNMSSPASDISLPIHLSSNNPASPTTESECSLQLSEEYRPETPNTSPTAGLIDNEEGPAFSELNDKLSSASSLHSSVSMPGKLNPELLNKVAAVINRPSKSTSLMHQKSFTEGVTDSGHGGNLPYMYNPRRTGGQKVLPQIDVVSSKGDHVKQAEINSAQNAPSPHGSSKFWHSTSAITSVINRRPTPYKAKKTPQKLDADIGEASNQQKNRFSTAGNLDSGKIDVEQNGMRRGTSHEILHSMSYGKELSGGFTPKEEKLMKQKAKDEKKRKEEEKRREKDQQKKQKEKLTKNGLHGGKGPPGGLTSLTVGNQHNASAYFNHSLDDIIQGLNHMIPLFVEKCVYFIETHGIATEGLYRIPANAKERENILRKFDEDNDIDLATMEVSVQTVAGCLTWFFSHKNLPEPLVPDFLHEELEEAISMPSPSSLQNLSIRGVIQKLPPSHYATFKYLCTHLNTVTKHEAENKMNSDNIALCWWPTLFRPELDDMKSVSFSRPRLKDVLLTCIVQCGFIFYNQPEV